MDQMERFGDVLAPVDIVELNGGGYLSAGRATFADEP